MAISYYGGSGNPNDNYQQARGYLQPFYDAGTNMLPQYTSLLQQLATNPVGFQNQIMSQYTASPYAEYQTKLLTQSAANQAAMGGQLGTPNEQIALENQTQGIVSKDQNQYVHNVMQPFQMGLSGEQGIVGQGMRAGEGMAAQSDLQAALAAKEKAAKLSTLGAVGGAVGEGATLAALMHFMP